MDFRKSDGFATAIGLGRPVLMKENAANERVVRTVHNLGIPSVFGQYSDFQRVGVDEKKRVLIKKQNVSKDTILRYCKAVLAIILYIVFYFLNIFHDIMAVVNKIF